MLAEPLKKFFSLLEYAASAIIPYIPIPLTGILPHNDVDRDPEVRYQLRLGAALNVPRMVRRVNMIDPDLFDHRTLDLCSTLPARLKSDRMNDVKTGDSLCLESSSCDVAGVKLPYDDEKNMQYEGVRHNVLATAQRIIHLSDADQKTWEVVEAPRAPFWAPPFMEHLWSDDTNLIPNKMLCLAFHSQWMTEAVMEEFSHGRRYTADMKERDRRADRLLASVYDRCVRNGVHYFIITNYDHWSFGVFTSNRSTVYVTPSKARTACDPNVLQSVVFWIQSSMCHKKGWSVPTSDAPPVPLRRRVLLGDFKEGSEFAARAREVGRTR